MINFSEVENSVRALKRQLAADEIDEITFEDRLLEMIDVAEDGYYWMFGHESERWFRHDGQRWVPDDPSKISARRSQTDVSASDSEPDQSSEFEALPVNLTWFIISLGTIVVIGCLVYFSTLAALNPL